MSICQQLYFQFKNPFQNKPVQNPQNINNLYPCSFLKYNRVMEEDKKSTNQLIRIIFQKCRDAGPQLVLLTKKIQEISTNNLLKQSRKVRKKDCLNPTFLIKLSQCGQNIRLILQHVVSLQFPGRQTIKRYYNQFMQVIYDIRKYHQQAHTNHDIHTNSTQMKSNLLQQLQQEIKKRQSLEAHLKNLKAEHSRDIGERQYRIRQLEDTIRDRDDINLSHISKISKKVDREFYGQFYGATGDKFIKVEEDNQGEIDMLKKKIQELQDLLNKNEQIHQEELGYHKQGILELQSKFQQLMKKNTIHENSSSFKLSTLSRDSPDKVSNLPPQPPPSPPEKDLQDDFYRLLTIQAITVQQFLGEESN